MAHDWLLQVTLPYDTGLPKDVVVNTWSFVGDDLTAAEAAAAALVSFYQAIDGVVLSALLSTAANACKIRIYDRAQPEPRVPQATVSFTLTTTAATTVPEACVCLSFQASAVSGQPQARKRGRVFIGPLASGACDTATGLVLGSVVTAIRDAGAALLAASIAASTWSWQVWSTTDNSGNTVTSGWVDNEFDIQRSRSISATSRSLF